MAGLMVYFDYACMPVTCDSLICSLIEIALKRKEQDEHFTGKSAHLHDYDWMVTRPIVSWDRQGAAVTFNVYSDSVSDG